MTEDNDVGVPSLEDVVRQTAWIDFRGPSQVRGIDVPGRCVCNFPGGCE